MGHIVFTDNVPFDMSDWLSEKLVKVYAGKNCAMAITRDGRVLQKTTNADFAARTDYWKSVKQISLSKWAEGIAIGAVEDGTCIIAKRPLRYICDKVFEDRCRFDFINDTVKSWNNITEVAASDAFFSLGADGRVRYVALDPRFDDYKGVLQWRNIVHIVTGIQNSIIGITAGGDVVGEGSNCVSGANPNLQAELKLFHNVYDAGIAGSECGKVLLALKDGRVVNSRSETVFEHEGTCSLESDFSGCIIRTPTGSLVAPESSFGIDSDKIFAWKSVESLSIGNDKLYRPFVVAVESDD